MEQLNNSFPCYYFQDKYENLDIEIEEKSNLSAFNLNFLKFYENLGENRVNQCNNFNFSPEKKKNTIDISYSMEQTFYENSHINIEEEFQQNEDTCEYN